MAIPRFADISCYVSSPLGTADIALHLKRPDDSDIGRYLAVHRDYLALLKPELFNTDAGAAPAAFENSIATHLLRNLSTISLHCAACNSVLLGRNTLNRFECPSCGNDGPPIASSMMDSIKEATIFRSLE